MVFDHVQATEYPNVSTTPITAMGCRQYLFLSVVQLKGKHCGKPHCRNKVVDTFGHCTLYPSSKDLKGRYHNYEKQVCEQLFLHFFKFQRGVMAAFWLCYRTNTKHKHKNLVSFLALWFPFVPKEGFHAKCVEA